MIERRQDLSLAGEAGHAVGVGRKASGRILMATSRAELGVGRTPDFAHAALAEFGRDAVMGDALLQAQRRDLRSSFTLARTPGESRHRK